MAAKVGVALAAKVALAGNKAAQAAVLKVAKAERAAKAAPVVLTLAEQVAVALAARLAQAVLPVKLERVAKGE